MKPMSTSGRNTRAGGLKTFRPPRYRPSCARLSALLRNETDVAIVERSIAFFDEGGDLALAMRPMHMPEIAFEMRVPVIGVGIGHNRAAAMHRARDGVFRCLHDIVRL